MKKFIVFGSNGFIGSNLVDTLSCTSKVVAVDLYQKPAAFKVSDNVKIIRSDIAKESKIIKDLITEELNGVVWAVGSMSPADKLNNETNIVGLTEPIVRLLRIFIERNIPVVFTSSAGMLYRPKGKRLAENDEVDPWTWYGLQKFVIEKCLGMLSKNCNNNRVKILRITSVYGERQPINRNQGVVAKLLSSAIKKEPFVLYGSENARRDYVYVGDLSKIIEIILNKDMKYSIYNVGTGKGKTLREVKEIIEKITDNRIEITRQEKRDIDPIHIDISNARLLKELKGFQFTNLEEGLQKTYIWYKESL